MSRSLVCALLVLCAPFALSGQTPPAAPARGADVSPDDTRGRPESRGITSERPFTLEEAIGFALRKNFDLQLQALTVENAKDQITIQSASFDPTITASGRRAVNQQASTTSRLDGTNTQGPRSDNTTMSAGVTQRLPQTNGSVNLTTNLSRGATNSANALVNPSYSNGITATINQPLLAGAGRQTATALLERAKLGLNIANINYRSRVLAVISDTENGYYNLVAARETLRIRQLTYQYNQKLLEENQARRSTGVATDLDVLSAEVGVASSQRGIVQAEQTVRDSEDRLLNLINVPEFEVRVGPVAFDDYRGGSPNFAQSYKLARDYYPEALSREETIKQLQIDLETARRNKLPDLDLIASLGYNARATNAGYQDAISNLPSDHGNNWALSLNYTMPWGKHADKARYRTAQTNITSNKVQLEQLEQALLVNVRAAVRSVEASLVAVEIASKGTELAVRQYEQQKARFDAGLSTSRQVLLVQDDLENARFSELSARLQLRRAVAELGRLEGSSLDRFGVQLPK